MLRRTRGKPAWSVPLLLFLAVLIVGALGFNLANLDTGGEGIPTGVEDSDPAPDMIVQLDPAVVDALLVAVSGTLLVAVAYVILFGRGRRNRVPKKRPSWELLASVLGLLLTLAVILAWPRIRRAGTGSGTADPGTVSGPGQNLTATPGGADPPLALLLAVTVFATILAVTYLLRRGAGRLGPDGGETATPPDERGEATQALRATIAELELGGDVRTAILGCFQRFCRLLGARGITDQVALTPRELERLAVLRLQVSAQASSTLTALFEEARYSEHRLGESDRARAIESLTGIRAVLEA